MVNLLGNSTFPQICYSFREGFRMCVDKNFIENTAQCQRKLFLKCLIAKMKSKIKLDNWISVILNALNRARQIGTSVPNSKA